MTVHLCDISGVVQYNKIRFIADSIEITPVDEAFADILTA